MKVVLASKVSTVVSGVTETMSSSIVRLDATDIEETEDLDGDKCYTITYASGGSSATTSYKQKDYIIAVMGG